MKDVSTLFFCVFEKLGLILIRKNTRSIHCAKMKFFIKDFFSKCEKNPEFTADLVTFTEQILTEKLHVFVQ